MDSREKKHTGARISLRGAVFIGIVSTVAAGSCAHFVQAVAVAGAGI